MTVALVQVMQAEIIWVSSLAAAMEQHSPFGDYNQEQSTDAILVDVALCDVADACGSWGCQSWAVDQQAETILRRLGQK